MKKMKKMKYKIYNNINIIEYGDIIGESSNSECQHDWVRGKGDYNIKCAFCIYYPSQDNRVNCSICHIQACCECLKSKNEI